MVSNELTVLVGLVEGQAYRSSGAFRHTHWPTILVCVEDFILLPRICLGSQVYRLWGILFGFSGAYMAVVGRDDVHDKDNVMCLFIVFNNDNSDLLLVFVVSSTN